MNFKAVIFDLGGVVFESPVRALRELEQARGVQLGSIGEMIRRNGDGGAFARIERGEIDAAGFFVAFNGELAAAEIDIPAESVLSTIESAMTVRPRVLARVEALRAQGYRVAALTNNARTSAEVAAKFDALVPAFDVFVESCIVGSRKPERGIYMALREALRLPFESMLFLDDLGANLKAARALGMTTLKVDDPDAGLDALAEVLQGRPRG